MSVKSKVESKVERLLSKPYKIILHNDDLNSFDWVIQCLVDICKHEVEQASQCAYIVHFKGECDVKYGEYEKLNEMKNLLINSGLSVTLEKN
jgi:ATP-dependent Clp protease adaptor protein ClpS